MAFHKLVFCELTIVTIYLLLNLQLVALINLRQFKLLTNNKLEASDVMLHHVTDLLLLNVVSKTYVRITVHSSGFTADAPADSMRLLSHYKKLPPILTSTRVLDKVLERVLNAKITR